MVYRIEASLLHYKEGVHELVEIRELSSRKSVWKAVKDIIKVHGTEAEELDSLTVTIKEVGRF